MLLNPISWKQNIAFHVLHFTHSVYILICILLLFQPKANAAFENVGVSARPMGMGGAYVALVNDTSAMIWNPAGLARLNEPEIGLNYLELYGLVNYSFVGWAYPLRLGRTVGVSVSSSSDPDGLYQELAFDKQLKPEMRKRVLFFRQQKQRIIGGKKHVVREPPANKPDFRIELAHIRLKPDL